MNPFASTSVFPMARAGGMFIFVVGLGVAGGALHPQRRRFLLALGAAIATIALILFGGRLSAPFGTPSRLQFWSLGGSIALEGFLIRIAVIRSRAAGERTLLLAILFAVGLHFLPMALAFGPACVFLGVALCACSGGGLWLRPGVALNSLWAVDGLVKMGFGALMFVAPGSGA